MTVTPVTQKFSASVQRAKLLRSLKLPAILLGFLVAMSAIVWLATPQRSDIRFAPDNPAPDGGRALAEVLKNQGVDVTFTRDYEQALALARPGTTLLIANAPDQFESSLSELARSGAGAVMLAPGYSVVEEVSQAFGLSITGASGYSSSDTSTAQCTIPAAVAAGSVESKMYGYELSNISSDITRDSVNGVTDGSVEFCFPMDWGAHLAHITAPTGKTVTMFDDSGAFSNARITTEGHAALALHLLGETDTLVWYLPQLSPPSSATGAGTGEVPIEFTLTAAVAALAVVFIAIWQSRRLGPLISEQLPVVVKSSETTLGRGRLYRSAGAREHAASALRAGTASRLGARLGLGGSSEIEHFVRTVAGATHRAETDIYALFYGPAPHNDAALTDLAQQLSELESEITE